MLKMFAVQQTIIAVLLLGSCFAEHESESLLEPLPAASIRGENGICPSTQALDQLKSNTRVGLSSISSMM